MKRIFVLLLLISFFESCTKKSVQLPETDNINITEIKDVSPAYLFYDETKKDSIELNRKNLIISTNWLVNVDKRLSLKQAIPSIIILQNKKRKAKMHKNEAAKNYFTCSNPDIKNLAFIDFTNVIYHEENSIEYFSKNDKINLKKRIIIDFISPNDITISSFSNNLFSKNSNNKTLIMNLKEILNEGEAEIILCFKNVLTFQDYISFKSILLKLNLPNVTISNNEFIYN